MSSLQPLFFAALFLAVFCLCAIAMPAQPEGPMFEGGQHQAEAGRAKRWSPYYYGAYGGWGGAYPYASSYYGHAYPYYSGYWW
ncbi:hypothetical protein niasHS_002628 [Heterodera schachtii]|uniref:Uncharacterized protein n=2 Tax=Heterodera TaxID=34509 RepID=A0ABD2K216_HETSC